MSTEELHSMKYVDLQKLAKEAGIRANQKIDKLIRALTEHYEISKEYEMIEETEMPEQVANDVSQIEKDEEQSKQCVSANTPKERKKRRRTFELEEATLKGDSTPVIENDQPRVTRLRTSKTPQTEPNCQSAKRLRRDTCNTESSSNQGADSPKSSTGSPSTRSIIDSVHSGCSSAERKERLLSAIEQKVQMRMASSPANAIKTKASQIPRFMAFLAKKKGDETANTPGSKKWNKIHQKEFAKFDSIDVYLDKKIQRKENLSASSKKTLPHKSPAVKPRVKIVKPVTRNPELPKVFKPTVISTKNINFDFSKTASDSNKTPAKTKLNFTPSRKASATKKLKEIGSNAKASPFTFTGNSTFNVTSSKKPVFDLKASLAKPLTWKPHTGKLQRVDINTHTLPSSHNISVTRQTVTSVSSIRNRKAMATASRDPTNRIKNRQQAKDVRRAVQIDRRSNQKYVDMMKRRGLMA